MDTFNQLIEAGSDTCDISAIRRILNSGMDVNQQNDLGFTALMFAVMPNEFGDINVASSIHEVVKILIQSGARVDLLDINGLSARDHCYHLIDPEFRDELGDCPLDSWRLEDLAEIPKILQSISS